MAELTELERHVLVYLYKPGSLSREAGVSVKTIYSGLQPELQCFRLRPELRDVQTSLNRLKRLRLVVSSSLLHILFGEARLWYVSSTGATLVESAYREYLEQKIRPLKKVG